MGVAWSKGIEMCSYNCDGYTCAESSAGGAAGSVMCSTEVGANLVVACKTGYQYNGLTLMCERTAPSTICPQPAESTHVYYWDDTTMACQSCELSNGCA